MIKFSDAHIIGIIISYLLGVFIVPFVINYSKKQGLVDTPNERKIHTLPISRLGGIAIWLSTILTFMFLIFLSYYPSGSLLSGLLLGSSLMFLLGLVDDIYGLNAKFKLIIQLSIASIVFLLGIKIEIFFDFFANYPILNQIISYITTVLWIVGISNALNFIDGIDGLAGSITTISSVTLALIAVAMVPSNPVSALIAFILAGSMLAFLTYNFHPAKIFMGDSGALFSGFLLATLSITGIMKFSWTSIFIPLLVLSVPILDITYSSLRRLIKGTSPFIADSEHIHHKFLKHGFSQNQIVLILSAFAITTGTIATLLVSSLLLKYLLFAIGISIIMLILSFFAKDK